MSSRKSSGEGGAPSGPRRRGNARGDRTNSAEPTTVRRWGQARAHPSPNTARTLAQAVASYARTPTTRSRGNAALGRLKTAGGESGPHFPPPDGFRCTKRGNFALEVGPFSSGTGPGRHPCRCSRAASWRLRWRRPKERPDGCFCRPKWTLIEKHAQSSSRVPSTRARIFAHTSHFAQLGVTSAWLECPQARATSTHGRQSMSLIATSGASTEMTMMVLCPPCVGRPAGCLPRS